MAATALLFPGQGSLTSDASDFARAACPELVDLACELVGDDPFARAGESTEFAQPAIFVASIAGWRTTAPGLEGVLAAAGHSLGELTALAATGALEVEDALRLVVLRGRLMARAADANGEDGGMVALLGRDAESAFELARDFGFAVANDNAPGQIVVSGSRAEIPNLILGARQAGLKALALDVAGAFHSPHIAAASQPFYEALRAVRWATPAVPVVCGLTAAPFTDPPPELAAALTAPVRWRETMAALHRMGARRFVDVGPGRVLERLVARNLPALEEHALAG